MLLVVLAAVPRYVLPADGFFFDDAWQASAAVKGSLRDLPLLGQTQPGFTLLLMAATTVFGSSDLVLMGPSLVAGSLGPAALYLVLRRLDASRPLAALTATALAACHVHIQYSGRVKTYPIDVLVVLGLVVAVTLLGRRTWTMRTTAGWLLACGGLISLSSTSMLAAACATGVLALHPRGDWRWRWGALGTQALFTGGFLLLTGLSVNTRSIAEFFEIRGATIGSHDPLSVPARTAAHLFRATRILVDLPDVLVVLVLVSSLAGLAILAFRGPHVLVGRFLIACLAVALLGSVAGVVPIGAPNNSVDRVNIWLFPVLAVGFARAATLLAGLVSPNLRRGLAIPAVALTMALGWQALTTEITYPLAGVTSAQERVMRELDDETAIWVTRYQVYGFVLEGSRAPNRGGNGDVNGDVSGDVSIVHQTHRNVGFAFDFDDPRLVSVLYGTEDEKLDASIGPGVNRVVVVSMRLPPDDENRKRLSWHLAFSGFERVANEDVGGSNIVTWERSGSS